MQTFVGICLFSLSFFFSSSNLDRKADVQPARLDNGLLPLTSLLEFPEHVDGHLSLPFSVDVSANGRLSHFRMLEVKRLPKGFVRKLSRTVSRARVQAARVGDRRVRVGVNGRLVYHKTKSSRRIEILPHSGFEHSELGWNYRGAQLLGGYQGLLRRMRRRAPVDTYAAVSFDILSSGRKTRFLVLRDRPVGQGVALALADVLAAAVFIPASSHGQPIEARTRWIFDGYKRGVGRIR